MKLQSLIILAATALPSVALDLSPRFITTVADGVAIRRPYFADGDKKYSLKLNVETELTPFEDGALFRFVKLSHAEMRLRPSPMSVELKIEAESQAQYEQAALRLLPSDAEGVVLDQVTANPLPMNGWTGVRFTFHYRMPTGEVRESVTFLNIVPTQQVVVQTASLAKDFPDASDRAYDIIRRWHEMDPKAVVGGS